MIMKLYGVSMFSSGGIADMGFRKKGVEFIASNEMIPQRAKLYQRNHPSSTVFSEDIYSCINQFIKTIKKKQKNIDLLLSTPPCQGMSSNGCGTLLKGIREGNKPEFDPRNSLIIPSITVIKKIRPKWIVFENVANMKNTIIPTASGVENILDVIRKNIPAGYVGESYIVEFADYGLPQKRKRLITIYSNDKILKQNFKAGVPLIPPRTHSKTGKGMKKWVSLKSALVGVEQLDSISQKRATSQRNHLHHVPVLDSRKYKWVKHAQKNSTAFDNQCVNPKCMFQGNRSHETRRKDNINRSRKDTPLFCEKCGEQMPRPAVRYGNTERIMSGFTSAYKRMSNSAPAPTLTTNFSYVSSDNKIHPTENRPLSIHEACILQSISNYNYKWTEKSGIHLPDSVIRDVIGESAPPLFFEGLMAWLLKISKKKITASY